MGIVIGFHPIEQKAVILGIVSTKFQSISSVIIELDVLVEGGDVHPAPKPIVKALVVAQE